MTTPYDMLIGPCAKYLQLYGIGILSSKWVWWKVVGILLILLLCVVNSFVICHRELTDGQDLYIFSCSLSFTFVTLLITIKVMFALYYRNEITNIFKWIQDCMSKKQGNAALDSVWERSYAIQLKYIVKITK